MQRQRQLAAETDQADIDVTPMLDVVFILLIFFIVTATFVKESGLDVTHEKPNQERTDLTPDQVILIRIEADNLIRVDNRVTDIRRVSAQITRLHAAHPERLVVIEPSNNSYTDTLVQVMDASRRANVHNFSLANAF